MLFELLIVLSIILGILLSLILVRIQKCKCEEKYHVDISGGFVPPCGCQGDCVIGSEQSATNLRTGKCTIINVPYTPGTRLPFGGDLLLGIDKPWNNYTMICDGSVINNPFRYF